MLMCEVMNAVPLIEKLDAGRLAEDAWRLVCIHSPTGNEREAALVYGEMLKEAGAEVEVDESIHESPCLIGRLRGIRPGRVLQLAGHIDHVDVPHAPPRREDGMIHARGSQDMKGGLAAILEIIRVLNESGRDFPGEILVTVYGLHEEPGGNTRGVLGPIKRGIVGDAAIVMEGRWNTAVTHNIGLARWDIEITHPDLACHETVAAPERDELQKTLLAVIGALREANENLQKRPTQYPGLRRESVFIGQIHYGDFFNRVPNECRLQGTRRWQPDRNFEEIQAEFAGWLEAIPCRHGLSIQDDLTFIGHSYAIDEGETIVQSLRRGYEAVTGKPLDAGPGLGVCDVQRLVVEGGVPTLSWGVEGDPEHGAHSDEEQLDLNNLHTACRIVLAAACDFLAQPGDDS